MEQGENRYHPPETSKPLPPSEHLREVFPIGDLTPQASEGPDAVDRQPDLDMIAIPVALPQHEEIVDLTREAQQREIRQQRAREASARWRQNHPDDYHAAQKRWRDKDPDATREAARRNMRTYRERKKQQPSTPLESA